MGLIDETYWIERALAAVCHQLMRLVEDKLRRFAKGLEGWVNELFLHRLPADWRIRLHTYLDEWEAEGFRVAPEHRPILEDWLEAWAKARGIAPDESTRFIEIDAPTTLRRHPTNPNTLYSLADGSTLDEVDVVLAFELAQLAEKLRIAIAASEAEFRNPGLATRFGDSLSRGGYDHRQAERLSQINELKRLLFHVEYRFTELRLNEIEWSKFKFPYGTGIEAAGMAARAGPPHNIQSVGIETAMDAMAIAGLMTLAAKLLARSGARLGQGLAKVVRPGALPREEATRLLKKIVDEELEKLSVSPELAQSVLRPLEIRASASPSIARMQFGNALERLVGDRVSRDPVLMELFEYHGRRAGPDFFGIGRFEGLTFDLTTPAQVAEHMARPYGPDLIIITYTRPRTFP